MSQAKVDKYKEEKRNRKATLEKMKRRKAINTVASWVIVAVIVLGIAGGIGYSVKKKVDESKQKYIATGLGIEDLTGVLMTDPSTDAPTENEGTETNISDAE